MNRLLTGVLEENMTFSHQKAGQKYPKNRKNMMNPDRRKNKQIDFTLSEESFFFTFIKKIKTS